MNSRNCPCCGGAMKTGVLSGMDGAIWIPEEKRRGGLKQYLSWEGIKKLCSELSSGIEIPYPGEGWDVIYGEVPAYHCPNCRIFLFEGREGKEIL